MTNTDLSILADALTFALILSIGGAVLYAVARATLRRTSRQMLVAGLPVMALLAVALAGTAVWPFARESVNEAVGVRLDELGRPMASDGSGLDGAPLAGFAGSSGLARPARLFAVATIGTDGGVDRAATAVDAPQGAVDGEADGGSDGGPGDGTGGTGGAGDGTGGTGDGDSGGGGTDPSPTDEPSPTGEPSPTTEPSPTDEPSPTTEPSPTDDPPGPPWGSPGPPPKSVGSS